MKQIKFLHFADLHLDTPFTSLGASDKARIRRQELKVCLRRIVSAAAEQMVDLLLICGDLYEHEYTDKATINFLADEFKKIPDIRIVIIPGNHDPYTGNSYYRSFKWPDNVHILAGGSSFVMFEDIKTCIYAQSCIAELQAELAKGASKLYKADCFNILMLHGTLDMGFNKNAWNPLETGQLDKLGMDYIALGHFHSRLQGGGRTENIYNPGSPEPLGFDEAGVHGVFIGSLTEKDSGEKIKSISNLTVNIRNYIKLEANINGCCTEEEVIQKVLNEIKNFSYGEDLYEIKLKGYTDESLRIDEAYIADSISHEAFYVRIIDASLPGYDFKAIAQEAGLRGLFTRKLLDRIERAATEKDRLLAERALIFGLQAMDNGRNR